MRQCTNSCSRRVKDVAMDASPAMRFLSESGQWPPTLEVFAAELLVVFCLSRQPGKAVECVQRSGNQWAVRLLGEILTKLG